MVTISKNFTLEELLASDTAKKKGIKNVPDTQAVVCLCALVYHVLQPLRDWWGQPIKIGSGYRSPSLNRAVGGVSNSQHLRGQAADLCIDGDLSKGLKWFDYIKNHLEYDQLLLEHNTKGSYWVHVSYSPYGNNRKQHIDNYLKV